MPGNAVVNDDASAVNALVSADEWAIECGRVACGVRLADLAWIDINFNMATNGAEALDGPLSLGDLPAPQFRRYRLAVMFPFGWRWSEEPNVWLSENAQAANWPKAPAYSARIVRGGWNAAELGQMASPPFFIRCPACHTVQTVGAHRRKGTPAPGKSLADETAVVPSGRQAIADAAPARISPPARPYHMSRRYH